MSLFRSLPLSDFCRGLVFPGTRGRECYSRRKFIKDMLFEQWTYFCLFVEISLAAGITAPAAHMNQVREGLRACGSFMKIRALSTKGVSGYHRLRLKTIPANWTAKIDLT